MAGIVLDSSLKSNTATHSDTGTTKALAARGVVSMSKGRAKGSELIDTVTHANLYSCLYATHQRNRAVLLLVVKEERTVRKPADKVIAPVLLDNPVLSHVDIIPKTRLLYQFYCINKL